MNAINEIIENLRKEYASEKLLEESVNKNPFKQFEKWMEEALKAEVAYPITMNLSTATKQGIPSGRIVLLRGFDENGFIFFTNYKSRKGEELIENPNACLNFFWHELEKQVRIEGTVEKVSDKDSDEYFTSRPRESQIGAWASNQSKTLNSRNELDEMVIQLQKEFDGKTVTRPPYWGGFIVQPYYFEFWQGRPNRLHDRLSYIKVNSGNWEINRLSP